MADTITCGNCPPGAQCETCARWERLRTLARANRRTYAVTRSARVQRSRQQARFALAGCGQDRSLPVGDRDY